MKHIREIFKRKPKENSDNNYTPKIIFEDVRSVDKSYEYKLQGCMVVGRNPEKSDISFPDEPTVSERQCRLYTEEGNVYITDLGGTNITYVNNKKLEDDIALRDGDVISFGKVDFYIRIKE